MYEAYDNPNNHGIYMIIYLAFQLLLIPSTGDECTQQYVEDDILNER